MKNTLLFFLLILPFVLFGQNNIKKTASVPYTQGQPTFTPAVATSSEIAIDTVTGHVWQWHRTNSTWKLLGQGIDTIAGNSAPGYTPVRNQSAFVINAQQEIYRYHLGSWHLINSGGGGGADDWGTQVAVTDGLTIFGTGVSGDSLSWGGAYVSLPLTGTGVPGDPIDVLTDGIQATDIAPSAVGSSELATNAVTTAKITDAAVTAAKLAQMGASSGQVLTWSGTAWAPAAVTGDGWGSTVVQHGSTLTGSGTAGVPLDVASDGIASIHIQDAAVGVTELAGNAVTDAKIRQGAGYSVIGRGANTTGNVADITAGTPGHVLRRSGSTIAFGTLDSTSLATGSVTSTKILDGTIDGADIAQQGAVAGNVLAWDGSTWAPAADANSGGTVTSIAYSAPSAGLTISGTTPVTGTGTWTFGLANDLAAVEGLSGTGIAVRTGTDTWTTRTLAVASNSTGFSLGQNNLDGVAGNPTINVDNSDFTWKHACRVATTGNITLSGNQSIDGVTTATNDRVLVKNQSTGANNGIYIANSGAWSRSSDAQSSGDFQAGQMVYVEEGTTQGESQWALTSDGAITVGSTSLTYKRMGRANQAVSGTYGSATQVPVILLNDDGTVSSVTNTLISASDGNGIYGGSDTIPSSTAATLTDNFSINYPSGVEALKISDDDPGNSIQLNYLSGATALNIVKYPSEEALYLTSPDGNTYIGVRNADATFASGAGELVISPTEFTFYDGRSAPNQKGLEYANDYSSNYTSRSLVDKAYVDAHSGGNGIYGGSGTISPNAVATMTADSRFLIHWNDGNEALSFNDLNGVIGMYGTGVSSIAYMELQEGNIDLGGETGGLDITGSGNQLWDYRNGAEKGWEYGEDYSAGFTDRSLVDKAYVSSLTPHAWAGNTIPGPDYRSGLSAKVFHNGPVLIREDTAHIRAISGVVGATMDTSEVGLYIRHNNSGNSETPPIWVQHDRVGSNMILGFDLDSASAPVSVPFTINQSYVTGGSNGSTSGADNYVVNMGLNLERAGNSYVTGRPSNILQWEYNFVANSAEGDQEFWHGFNPSGCSTCNYRTIYATSGRDSAANSVITLSGNTTYFANGGKHKAETKGLWTSDALRVINPTTNGNATLQVESNGTGTSTYRLRDPNSGTVKDAFKFSNGLPYLEVSTLGTNIKLNSTVLSFDYPNAGNSIISARYNSGTPNDTLNFGWDDGTFGSPSYTSFQNIRMIMPSTGALFMGTYGNDMTYYTALGKAGNDFYINTASIGASGSPSIGIDQTTGNVGMGKQLNTIGSSAKLQVWGGVESGQNAAATVANQNAHASGSFTTDGDAQASEFVLRRSITGTSATELFTNGSSTQAVLPATNRVWTGTAKCSGSVVTVGNGTTIAAGDTYGSAQAFTIKRIGTNTSLVGTVTSIGSWSDTNMAGSAFTISADDATEALKITFTPPTLAGSTTVCKAVCTVQVNELGF